MPLVARLIRYLSAASAAAGLLLLACAAVAVLEAWLGQSLGRRELIAQAVPAQAAPSTGVKRRPKGSALATLAIERLGLSVVVLEGSDDAVLKRGPGHIEDTAYPGEPGNIAIAGHRDTHFRILRNIRIGDAISVSTPERIQKFFVDSTEIIQPTEMGILDPTTGPALTLVTCYPFEYVGNAPLRFIVRATPRTASRDAFSSVKSKKKYANR